MSGQVYIDQHIGMIKGLAVFLLFATSGVLFLLFGNVIIIPTLGLFVSTSGFIKLYMGRRTWLWPETNARILSSEILEKKLPTGFIGTLPHYVPKCRYSYTVKQQEFVSDRISLDEESIWSLDRRDAEQFLYQYTHDDRLIAFYNPRKPTQAILFRGYSKKRWSHHWAIAVSGLLITALGLLLWSMY